MEYWCATCLPVVIGGEATAWAARAASGLDLDGCCRSPSFNSNKGAAVGFRARATRTAPAALETNPLGCYALTFSWRASWIGCGRSEPVRFRTERAVS